MKQFSVFRVRNGWIVQTYGGSTGFSGNDANDYRQTFVFTTIAGLAQFLSAAVAK